MSSALLYRLSGTALVFGALLSIVYHVVHPGGSGLDYYSHPATSLSHLSGFVAVLLVLLGLPGLHAYQADAPCRSGSSCRSCRWPPSPCRT
jgi:hypothetical protein